MSCGKIPDAVRKRYKHGESPKYQYPILFPFYSSLKEGAAVQGMDVLTHLGQKATKLVRAIEKQSLPPEKQGLIAPLHLFPLNGKLCKTL